MSIKPEYEERAGACCPPPGDTGDPSLIPGSFDNYRTKHTATARRVLQCLSYNNTEENINNGEMFEIEMYWLGWPGLGQGWSLLVSTP